MQPKVNLVTCQYCKTVMENNPGYYYHYSACWANAIRNDIKELKSDPNYDKKKLRMLERELQTALNVGD